MVADLDLLLIAVYCTADDLLPVRAENARRMLTDAEVSRSCVAQAMMGIPCDGGSGGRPKRLAHLFPRLPSAPRFLQAPAAAPRHDRGADPRVREHSPGFEDDLLFVDSTPVECARSRETEARRSQLADAADYGYCAATPASSGASGCTPYSPSTALPEPSADQPKVDETRRLPAAARTRTAPGALTVIGDKGFAGQRLRRRPPPNSMS